MKPHQAAARGVLLAVTLLTTCHTVPPSTLDGLRARGVLRVGTTGDYRPFSFVDTQGRLRGYDIDAAQALGKALALPVRLVRVTWGDLVEGIVQGRYDIAMGGISRTPERARAVAFTQPYWRGGKCLLIRRTDTQRLRTLADVDRADVKVGVNPGGTNERFVRQRLHRAQVVTVQDNTTIPQLVASGTVDVMITDAVEALVAARQDRRLYAVDPTRPVTTHSFAYMTRRNDPRFVAWLDTWIARRHQDGTWQRLRAHWIDAPAPPASTPPRSSLRQGPP